MAEVVVAVLAVLLMASLSVLVMVATADVLTGLIPRWVAMYDTYKARRRMERELAKRKEGDGYQG